MDRRDFNKIALAGAALSALSRMTLAQDGATPLRVTALIHDDIVMLDLVAPMTVFNLLRAEIALVSMDGEPVRTELGLPIAATSSFADAPGDPDVLFVPGGLAGTVASLEEPATRDFLAKQGEQAEWVTSVCTGSLLLGAAGLLNGYSATSHWYVRDLLTMTGAVVATERVVEDRSRITGGGVTAGLDFALRLAAKLRGEDTARRIQLVLEYDPDPPFDTGSPERAGHAMSNGIMERRSPLIDRARDALSRLHITD